MLPILNCVRLTTYFAIIMTILRSEGIYKWPFNYVIKCCVTVTNLILSYFSISGNLNAQYNREYKTCIVENLMKQSFLKISFLIMYVMKRPSAAQSLNVQRHPAESGWVQFPVGSRRFLKISLLPVPRHIVWCYSSHNHTNSNGEASENHDGNHTTMMGNITSMNFFGSSRWFSDNRFPQ